MAISCAAVAPVSRAFSVLWDGRLYLEQKRAPCPHMTPRPADLLISSPTNKNLPEFSPSLLAHVRPVQKRLKDLSSTVVSCLYSRPHCQLKIQLGA